MPDASYERIPGWWHFGVWWQACFVDNVFTRDPPKAEFHLIGSGHFALEDRADEIIPLIQGFLGRILGNNLHFG